MCEHKYERLHFKKKKKKKSPEVKKHFSNICLIFCRDVVIFFSFLISRLEERAMVFE